MADPLQCPPTDYKANRAQDIQRRVIKWELDSTTVSFNASLFEKYTRMPVNKQDVGCRYGVNPAKIKDNNDPEYLRKIQGKMYYLSVEDFIR